MPLSEKAQYHLERAMELAQQGGDQIFGFVLSAEEGEETGDLGMFSSHQMTEDKFVEAVSSAATLLVSKDFVVPTAQA